ncbi:MAG: hypothetical protein AAF799_30195 [Myxococcota bacterium]
MSLSTKLAQAFSAESAFSVTTGCDEASPSLLSLTFHGEPLQVKGISEVTPPELTPGLVPPNSTTPHWQHDEHGCYPGLFDASQPMAVSVTLDADGLALDEYELLGVSRQGGIVCNESTLTSATTFRCTLQAYSTAAGISAWTMEWALRKKGTLEHFIIGSCDINLIFAWGRPCGRWTGKAVWYEALWVALGRCGSNRQKTQKLCLGAIVDGLVQSDGLRYDTLMGAAGCGWTPLEDTPAPFNLAKFIQVEAGVFNKTGFYEISPGVMGMRMPVSVSCYDLSAGLCLLGCALGLNMEVIMMGNPDSSSSTVTMSIRDDLRAVGFLTSHSTVGAFATHVCTRFAGEIYDAVMSPVDTDGVHPLFGLSATAYFTATVSSSTQRARLPSTIRTLALPFDA